MIGHIAAGNVNRLPFYFEGFQSLSEEALEEIEKRHEEAFKVMPSPTQKYQLQPECRHCYELFGDWEGLKAHLATNAHHETVCRYKEYNKLVDDAQIGGWVKCHECGRVPAGMHALWHHMAAKKHRNRKASIIPRWKEDHALYDEKEWAWWKGREAKEERAHKKRQEGAGYPGTVPEGW